MKLTKAVVHISQDEPVRLDRPFVAGPSTLGGFGAWHMGMRRRQFAAVMVVFREQDCLDLSNKKNKETR